ncbi:SURF1 family protein [Microcella sp.]|uniref:SURF1 family protein n=1 Tax=Microcella sp. TaxID=1913979 RepID=UPI003F725C57
MVQSATRPGAPGFWSIARRPRWIAALLLALGIAGGFAALGQWQLERSLESTVVDDRDTETPVPLDSVAEPQQVMTTDASGRLVSVSGEWVAGDDLIVTGRLSGDDGSGAAGEPGDWVVRHLVTEGGASLAVAVGYGPVGAGIPDLPSGDAELTGRYVPSESPQQSDFEAGERTAIAVAELINLWREPGPVYSGYLVLDDAPAGLETVAAPPPEGATELNLLNLFYAIEWVIFGGFAVYLWWRLVKDEQEKLAGPADDEAADSPQPAPLN